MSQAKLLISELEALAEKARKLAAAERRSQTWDMMLPRRREIWEILRDHPQVSFDFIRRRFAGVNPKTLHYDLGQLQKLGWVKRIGVSRGSVYSIQYNIIDFMGTYIQGRSATLWSFNVPILGFELPAAFSRRASGIASTSWAGYLTRTRSS